MTDPQSGLAYAVPVIGTVAGRGAALARRSATALTGTAIIGGFAAALMPWGLTPSWLAAVCGLVLVAAFTAGLRRDLRSVGQLWITAAPPHRLVLRGTWRTSEYDLTEVEAVQMWCGCGAGRSVAAHRDGMAVLLRGGGSVRVEPGTVLPPDAAMTLGELLAPAGVKVVDWGETGAVDA
jgi:hypothetical protein